MEKGNQKSEIIDVMKKMEKIFSRISLLDPREDIFADLAGDIIEDIERLRGKINWMRDFGVKYGNYEAIVTDLVDVWDNLYDMYEEFYNIAMKTSDVKEIESALKRFRAYFGPFEENFYDIKSTILAM